MQTNTLIATILRHEAKTTSYKIALVRSLNDVVLGYPDLDEAGASIAVPLRLLASLWIGYYWPFTNPDAPIEQGRHSAKKQDLSFRAALTELCSAWTDFVGTYRPADGVYLNNELLNPHRRAHYPSRVVETYNTVINAIVRAIRQPIRYAGPGGQHSLLAPPRRWSDLRRTAIFCVPVPQTQDQDLCLVVDSEMWRGFRDLSLWIEALCIHEWCLYTESITAINRGLVYSLLTDRPDNRRPLTWERNCIEILMLEGHSFICPWTEKVLTTRTYDMDHLLPISIYPTNELWNLLPADREFNQRVKRNRLPSPQRLSLAKPHFITSYRSYGSSSELAPVLRHDAAVRFHESSNLQDFPAYLAERTAAYIQTVAESRNIERF